MSENENFKDEKETNKPGVVMETSKSTPAKKAKAKKKEQSAASGIATWFKEVKAETFKIVWPNRKELIKMTFTVVVTSLLFGGAIAGMDVVFRFAVDYLVSVF